LQQVLQREAHAPGECCSRRCDGKQLAHQIKNPLQSLTNILFLAATGNTGPDGKMAAESADPDLQMLSNLVKRLLALPTVFNAGGGKDPAIRSSGK
jgi:hypothetical protein